MEKCVKSRTFGSAFFPSVTSGSGIGATSSPSGGGLLRRVVERRLCAEEVVLEVAQAAVVSWGLWGSSAEEDMNLGERKGYKGGGRAELFCCPELDCLISVLFAQKGDQKHQQEDVGDHLFLAVLRRLHLFKTHHAKAKSCTDKSCTEADADAGAELREVAPPPLLPLLSLLLIVSCLAKASFSYPPSDHIAVSAQSRYNTAPSHSIPLIHSRRRAIESLLSQYLLAAAPLRSFQHHAHQFLRTQGLQKRQPQQQNGEWNHVNSDCNEKLDNGRVCDGDRVGF